MIKSIEECPVDLSLQVACNEVDCAIESFLTVEETKEKDKFLLIMFTDNKNLTGDWSIELQALDSLSQMQSKTVPFILRIINPCADQRITISPLAVSIVQIELGRNSTEVQI